MLQRRNSARVGKQDKAETYTVCGFLDVLTFPSQIRTVLPSSIMDRTRISFPSSNLVPISELRSGAPLQTMCPIFKSKARSHIRAQILTQFLNSNLGSISGLQFEILLFSQMWIQFMGENLGHTSGPKSGPHF